MIKEIEMKKLFRERLNKLSESQLNDGYVKLAKDIICNGWGSVPKYEIGTELNIRSNLHLNLKVGDHIFVNGYNEDKGMYKLSKERYNKSNYLIGYEIVEKACKPI